MGKKYYIIDGNSFIYRAFFAVPKFTTRDGQMTNAIFGFFKMVTKLMRQTDHDHIIVAFDSKEPSFRNEMYAEYKAHRDAMPDDLISQFPYVKQLVTLFSLPTLELPGVEADDAIATFVVTHNTSKDDMFYIVTGDKDMMQLVCDNVFIYDTMKEKVYDREGVYEKMGVYPENITDLLGLMGDSSDNIPGVKGVGPKTAIKIIHSFGSLEGALEHAMDIPGKIGATIAEQKEQAILSKKLTILKKDIDISHLKLHMPPPDAGAISDFCTALEFYSLKKEIAELFGERNTPSAIAEIQKKPATALPEDLPSTPIASLDELQKILTHDGLTYFLDGTLLTLGYHTTWHTLDLETTQDSQEMSVLLMKHLEHTTDATVYDMKALLHFLSSYAHPRHTHTPQPSLF